MLDGVEAAHLHGVVHRDLKPANVLCDGPDNLVLADFGIAHFQEFDLLTLVETDSQERLGNYQYSAPEQRIPGASVDQRADIFALGLILNEMFTGHVPQGTGYPKIGSVSPDFAYLDDLGEAMIQQKPENRIQTIVRVKEQLIARRHRFVELQRLDALKKQVVPESDVNEPILRDPITPVEAESFPHCSLRIERN